MLRRSFVKSLAGLPFVSAVAASVGSIARAAWPSSAFKSEKFDAAFSGLFGPDVTYVEDGTVELKAPEIAENGSVVPVVVSSSLPAVSTAVFVEKNPHPLAFHAQLDGSLLPISTRIKMQQTSHVLALVQTADGVLHAGRKEVKVTIGGCGG